MKKSGCDSRVAENAGVDPVYSPLLFVFFLHLMKSHLQFCFMFFRPGISTFL